MAARVTLKFSLETFAFYRYCLSTLNCSCYIETIVLYFLTDTILNPLGSLYYKICLLTYKNTNQQPTYFYNSLSFRHILFLHDLLIHLFFPFHKIMSDHHLAKGLSLSSVHDSGIHSLLIPETRLLYQYSVLGSKTHFQNCVPSLGSFQSPYCLSGFWFMLFSFYALSNDT